jgi:hypothetical protein
MTGSPIDPEQNPYQAPAAPIPSPSFATPGNWPTVPVVELLAQTRPWVMFIAILGFICSGLMIIGGLFAAVVLVAMGGAGMVEGAVLLVYPVLGVVYYFPSQFLFRFAQRIRDLRYSHNVADLEAALAAQKSFWKFCGIFLAFVIALYVGILVVAMLAALLSAR